MESYLNIVAKVLNEGVRRPNRTGIDTLSVPGCMFEHDMRQGFPLLTTKRVPFKLVASELEFFIRGYTDKQWLQDAGNHIWDAWCNPEKVPYGHDPETIEKMRAERDLGPIYGWQWRYFGAAYEGMGPPSRGGVDQLREVLQTLEKDPGSRRMLVTAWNPAQVGKMALSPCHFAWQVTVTAGRLNLLWNQRSVDVALGLPFNIARYGLLLYLLAKHTRLEVGRLVGFLGDTHIYLNHIEGLKEQCTRPCLPLCQLSTPLWAGLFEWLYTDTLPVDYQHHPAIPFEIAV